MAKVEKHKMFSSNNSSRKTNWRVKQRAGDWTNGNKKGDSISCMANGTTESEPYEIVVMYSEAQK